jgi:MFS family permease
MGKALSQEKTMHPARVYYVFVFTFNLGLSIVFVTYTLFLRSRGLSLSEIVLANACFLGSAVMMELPTGMLADGRGRAWSLKMGVASMFAGLVTYVFARNFAIVAISEFLLGLGAAFFSGAEDAWITDALGKRGESDRLKRVLGTATMFRQGAMMIGSGIGVLVGYWDERFPWFCSGALMVIPFAWCLTRMNGIGEPEHRMTELRAFASSVRALVQSRALIWVAAVESSFGLLVFFNLFWNISFETRIGRAWLYGVWILIQGSIFIGGWLVRTWKPPISAELGMILIIGIAGASLMLMASADPLIIVLGALALNEAVRGMFRPFLTAYVQEKIESGFRATYGSLHSGLTGAIMAGMYTIGFLFLRSMPATQRSMMLTWKVSAMLLVACSFLLWIVRPKTA